MKSLPRLYKRRIAGSRSAVWRFLQRHKISVKKSLRAAKQERTDVARARRRWMREPRMFDPARLVFLDETATLTIWCGFAAAVHVGMFRTAWPPGLEPTNRGRGSCWHWQPPLSEEG
jgi:hypothetical protein